MGLEGSASPAASRGCIGRGGPARRYDRLPMVARRSARLLAPAALVATIVVTILVVEHGLSGRKSSTATASRLSGAPVRTSRSHPRAARGASPSTASTTSQAGASATYLVKPGDSFSAISARTGVPLPTLEALNPGVDPRALHAGQHLRLRR